VPTLSIHRAFVVRLYDDVDLPSGRIGGQVEHVLSGEGGEFRSVEELLRLMRQALCGRPPNEMA
jgi:hypothetical protein